MFCSCLEPLVAVGIAITITVTIVIALASLFGLRPILYTTSFRITSHHFHVMCWKTQNTHKPREREGERERDVMSWHAASATYGRGGVEILVVTGERGIIGQRPAG